MGKKSNYLGRLTRACAVLFINILHDSKQIITYAWSNVELANLINSEMVLIKNKQLLILFSILGVSHKNI